MLKYSFDKEYDCYAKDTLKRSRSLQKFKSVEKEKKPNLIHDVWNCYCYGELLKIVYIKSASNKKITPPNIEKNKKSSPVKSDDSARFSQSLSRTKSRIFELAMCNEFRYFCTFTQNKELRNRFNLDEFRKDFAQLVRNLNRTRTEDNKIKYILIPEEHKKGGWHMHGLLQGLTGEDLREFTLAEKLPHKIRNQLINGEKVYNWEKYSKKFGFFTCTAIKDNIACSKYITKYITKDLQQNALENNIHLFFASQGLKGRETLAKNCPEFCPVDTWDFENDYVKIKEIPLSEIQDTYINLYLEKLENFF